MAAEGLRRHYDLVFRYVRRRSRSHVEAEDLTQEVFADASAALARTAALSERQTLAWLYTVAARRIADEARRASRRPAVSESPLELASTPQSEYGPTVAQEIRRAIAELPAAQREVVLWKLFDGQAFAGIAARLEITEAAAKMRYLRGLQAVQASLRKEGIEP